jgi:branched-chain amino acid transport system ATP-binding protein
VTAPGGPPAAIELTGIAKSYGQYRAVDGVDLVVPHGGVTALIGPNGAGKSTLFGIVAGDLAADTGRVLMAGQDITGTSASGRARLGLGRTFQTARVFERLSALKNAVIAVRAADRAALRFYDQPRASRTVLDRARAGLDLVALGGRADRTAALLAQGERKRLEIALALTGKPRILLLDEPTAGVGREDAQSFVRLIGSLRAADPDLTALLTAHDMDVVFGLADTVVLLSLGKVVLSGSPDEVAGAEVTRRVYLGDKLAIAPAGALGGEG